MAGTGDKASADVDAELKRLRDENAALGTAAEKSNELIEEAQRDNARLSGELRDAKKALEDADEVTKQ